MRMIATFMSIFLIYIKISRITFTQLYISFRESVFEIIWGILQFCLFYNSHVLRQNTVRFFYSELKITPPTWFFAYFQQKSGPRSIFFFLNFPRYRAFFAYFLQKKKHVFFFKNTLLQGLPILKMFISNEYFFQHRFSRRLRKSFG